MNRFETALTKLEGMKFEGKAESSKKAKEASKEEEPESTMEDITFFRTALQSFLDQSAKLDPEIHAMSKLAYKVCECMVQVYLHSEFM